MPGERGMNCDVRGLGVAYLADHDHVGILANERAQSSRKSQANLRLDLGLVDSGDLVFDRILNGENLCETGY